MPRLTLAQASIIVDAALAKARADQLTPVTVAVLDAGGHLVAFKREDRSGLLRFDIAFGKAWGALGMGFGSRALVERAASGPAFATAIAVASGGRVVPVPGGVLIEAAGADGTEVIGAVGVTGASSDQDEACGLAGIAAAGLLGRIGA